MPPEQRRAEIIAATVPLVLEHGAGVSTRQIAEAAGVAEGTLFRVFPDKRTLVNAAIETAVDPETGIRRLEAIDASAPLADRLTEAVEMLSEGMRRTWQLMVMIRTNEKEKGGPHIPRPSMERLNKSMERLFEPDAHRLAIPVSAAARVLGAMLVTTMDHVRPGMYGGRALTTAEVVDVLLHGLVAADQAETTNTNTDTTTTHEGSR